MKKIIVFGNSASGKSTLASHLAKGGLAHLDLDTIAWMPTALPTRMSIDDSKKFIDDFTTRHTSWVIEGCYADLLELVSPLATEAIFMNLDVASCIENAKQRPWEPHKYATKEAQDKNLAMLIQWISEYPLRSDTFSKSAHELLFANFHGHKQMITQNCQLR